MSRIVHVRAPARLHFGMFAFGQASGPQFGGVGMMVEPPALELVVRPADEFCVSGELAPRTEACARTVFQQWKPTAPPACEITVQRAPPTHVGLGTGTQLSLAVATGLARFLNRPQPTAAELAHSTGRGKRSAIGTHGFLGGGLIVDAGKSPEATLGELADRRDVPADWRVVLIRANNEAGLSGGQETSAFAQLPPVPIETTEQLWQITRDQMLPAVERSDCRAFGEAVYQFGTLAGECFSSVQGGPFASPQAARLVESIRQFGIPGVGQSSWGPTLFAITGDQAQADSLVAWLQAEHEFDAGQLTIACPINRGAIVRCC
jgi:beta-RFAP synthase